MLPSVGIREREQRGESRLRADGCREAADDLDASRPEAGHELRPGKLDQRREIVGGRHTIVAQLIEYWPAPSHRRRGALAILVIGLSE